MVTFKELSAPLKTAAIISYVLGALALLSFIIGFAKGVMNLA